MSEHLSNHCFGPGNVREFHLADSTRTVEYRGGPSLPWEKRVLCEGCIADVRHAGMEIKGESSLWVGGVLPDVSETAKDLLGAVIATSCACGEWTSDDDEPYAELSGQAAIAQNALAAYIADLESSAGAGPVSVLDDDERKWLRAILYHYGEIGDQHISHRLRVKFFPAETEALSDATGVR